MAINVMYKVDRPRIQYTRIETYSQQQIKDHVDEINAKLNESMKELERKEARSWAKVLARNVYY